MSGVEFVGSSGPSADTEVRFITLLLCEIVGTITAVGLRKLVPMQVIAMAADALDALGIKDKVVLELNSLGDNER